MPIYDHDGTTGHTIGKIYDHTGTTAYQIGKIYDNNGTTSSLIYQSSVVVTNLVGGAKVTVRKTWSDAGYAKEYYTVKNVAATAGHRYYVRGTWQGRGLANGSSFLYETAAYGNVQNTESFLNGSWGHYDTQFNQKNLTFQDIKAASSRTFQTGGYFVRSNQTSGYSETSIYMIVDITPLEQAMGKTLSANEVYALFGNNVFFGSKEISI